MWLVRPARSEDLSQVRDLSLGQGPRVSSTLPREDGILEQRILESVQAFERFDDKSNPHPRFLFVLEDLEAGRIRGVAGIDARAGSGQPFYSYRRDALIHASHELGISRRVEVLYPSHALTDKTLLCSLVIDPELVGSEAFELLSRSRMLFMAENRECFSREVVVEIQGLQTPQGGVPFWDSLGRHFFDMDFATADQHSASLSKTFIAELMPANPIYVCLLSDAAREAMGKPHQAGATAAACELLQHEGFHKGDYLDIFDGGPVLEARTDSLKTLVTSHSAVLHPSGEHEGETCLVSAGEGADFRCTLTVLSDSLDGEVKTPTSTWQRLGVTSGDRVRVSPL